MMSRATHARCEPVCTVVSIPALGGERRAYRGIVQPFAAHAHADYVIGRVRAGVRELELNGQALVLSPGDVIAFNPGDVHGCHALSEVPFAYDSVTVAPELFDGVVLRCFSGNDPLVSSVCDHLLQGLEVASAEEVRASALKLAHLLAVDPEHRMPSAHEAAALRVYAHFCGHLASPLRIVQLAAAEGISEHALIRAYRKRFSITPAQHLLSLRIEAACSLLTQGIAVGDVAVETGFADQAHFTRAFKQRMGITPSAYRKMVKKGSPS